MHGDCPCEHHSHHPPTLNTTTTHILSLLLNNFVSPYKILFMLDPKQADHFKARNQSSGCCAANHITIKDQELTATEKYLKEAMSYSSLIGQLDAFLSNCMEAYTKIIESGKKDNLEVTQHAEKYVLDQVMSESINRHLLAKLSKRIREEAVSNNREIGLWATPATWYQKYPQVGLNFLSGEQVSQLVNRGWTVSEKYVANPHEILRELSIMEKDGKFQTSKWLKDKDNKAKVLNNPQKFIEIKTSNQKYLFEELRELVIKLSSIPFQLNAKANLFCTVSPNLHILYSKLPFNSQKTTGQLRYTLIINIGQEIIVNIDQREVQLQRQSLLLFESKKAYTISNNSGQVFLMVNYIGCVEKK